MPYSTEIRQGLLLLRHKGNVTQEEVETTRAEVLELVRLHKLSRVIIDLREVTSDVDSDALRSVMEANAKVVPPRPHAAVIVRDDQHPQLRFIEDFAVSRGMPVRVFVSEDDAMDWLAG
jgi:hypothetical protein